MSSENALDLLCRLGKNLKTRTGVRCIDDVLDGGFDPGEMYELVGAEAVGKTQILYAMAAVYLQNHNGQIVWIDMNGSFVPSRFLSFVKNSDTNQTKYLGRIHIAHAYKSYELEKLLGNLQTDVLNVKLLLIDNIGSILGKSTWLYKNGGGREQIQSVVGFLNKCRDQGLTIVLTNHLTSGKNGINPALGYFWRTDHVKKRYVVGRDDISRFVRKVKTEGEDYLSPGSELSRFSVEDYGIQEFDNLSL